MPPILRTTATTISYDGRPVLTVPAIELEEHSRIGVIGASGAGKSTLAAYLGGFLPTAARADGRLEIGCTVGAVVQDAFGALNPLWRVDAQVALTAGSAAAATGALESVGLPRQLHHRHPLELSGGQRQRVALAFALARDPGILIADEITAALDPATTAAVVNLLAAVTGPQAGRTLVFLSHDLAAVRAVCPYVLEITAHTDGPGTAAWIDPASLPVPAAAAPGKARP